MSPPIALDYGLRAAYFSANVGEIEAIFRYPVKSMRGELLDNVVLGWHGLEGDRRLHFVGSTTVAAFLG